MDGKLDINTNVHVQFPAGWGVAISKRNVAGRLESEGEEQNSACKEIHYADTYLWFDENSLWVVKGIKGNHEALDRYHETPEANFEDFIRTIDAVYYPHWNHHEALKRVMSRSLEHATDETSAPDLAWRFEEVEASEPSPSLKVVEWTDFQ